MKQNVESKAEYLRGQELRSGNVKKDRWIKKREVEKKVNERSTAKHTLGSKIKERWSKMEMCSQKQCIYGAKN